MGAEYRGKTFKSGNSVAVRLPKSLGIKEGEQVRLVELAKGNLRLEIVPAEKRKFNVAKVWGIGKHLDLKLIADEDRVFEHRSLLWEDPEWLAAAAERDE